MKRFTRRMVAIATGLSIGWIAAGWRTTGSFSFAGDEPATPHHGADHTSGSHVGADQQTVTALAPHGEVVWLRPMLTAVVVLFIAAIVLGATALALKGPDPPEPDEH